MFTNLLHITVYGISSYIFLVSLYLLNISLYHILLQYVRSMFLVKIYIKLYSEFSFTFALKGKQHFILFNFTIAPITRSFYKWTHAKNFISQSLSSNFCSKDWQIFQFVFVLINQPPVSRGSEEGGH